MKETTLYGKVTRWLKRILIHSSRREGITLFKRIVRFGSYYEQLNAVAPVRIL